MHPFGGLRLSHGHKISDALKRLRSNLVQCAQLVLMYAEKWKGNFGDWVRKMRDSGKKHGVIVCAIAAKLARIIYRLMKDKVDYTPVLSC